MEKAKIILAILILNLLSACSFFDNQIIEIATDVPEIALYASMFNSSQNQYKVSISFQKNLSSKIIANEIDSTLVMGRYLLDENLIKNFYDITKFSNELKENNYNFYPNMLKSGAFEEKQFLLPVSFNLPLIIFNKSMEADFNSRFVMDIKDLQENGKKFNKSSKKALTNMGFGPRWNPEFLYTVLTLFGVNFSKGQPLLWNQDVLQEGILYLQNWTKDANGSATIEDDFEFKYLYLPPYKSIKEKRIGFSTINSNDYFIIAEDLITDISFLFLSKDNKVPTNDDIVYAAILKNGKNKKAAKAFLKWFYSEETQKAILTESNLFRTMESSFGIAGGLSAIINVTETLFPLFYPSLLGKLPPTAYIETSQALPTRWKEIKSSVILPFLKEATSDNPPKDIQATLESNITLWDKRHNIN